MSLITLDCKGARRMVHCRDYSKRKRAAHRMHRREVAQRLSTMLQRDCFRYVDFNHQPKPTHLLTSWQIC